MNWKQINWPRLVAGILMFILPFAGPWWTAEVGEGALEFGISPFDMRMVIGGQPLHSDLIGLFLLATKISFLVAGVFVVLSALSPRKWWSPHLCGFGIRKPLWSVVGIVLTLLLGAFFVNVFLPGLLSSMGEGAEVQLNVPYLAGASTAHLSFQSQGSTVEITAPLEVGLTGAFWLAVITVGCALGSGIYSKRVSR